MIGYKKCRGNCQRILPIKEFSVNGRSRDGFHYKCKECWAKQNRERNLPVEDHWIEKVKANLVKMMADGRVVTWVQLCRVIPKNNIKYRTGLIKALKEVHAVRITDDDFPELGWYLPKK